MSEQSEFRIEMPHGSPLVPVQLWAENTFRFNCHKGIACFNKCCENADILLSPWDIVRIARHFGLRTREAIDRYTEDFEMDGQGMPGLKLKRKAGSSSCIHLTPEGCGIYADRPVSCRYYALGSVAMRKKDSSEVEESYVRVKESYCLGHNEPQEQTIAEYRQAQGVEPYDAANRAWRDIVLKKRSSGPTVGKAPVRSYELFFLASYDLDGFRAFALSDKFAATFVVDADAREAIETDDVACLAFAMRFLRQSLFGEITIEVREGEAERRRRVVQERLLREEKDKATQLAEQQDQQYDSLKEQGW